MSPAKYGQHFLIDDESIQKIVEALEPQPTDFVLEIGPGKGVLTKPILERVGHLTSIEIDPKLVSDLKYKWGQKENFKLIQGDILEFDFSTLPNQEFKVAGNIPYALTSPILRKLSNWDQWSFAIIMVQKEVGKRLCAKVGTKAYGALTVGMNLVAEMEPVFELSKSAFRPPPKVDSIVIKLTRRPTPLTDNIGAVQKVVQAAFQQRRKTILNSLSHGLHLSKDKVEGVLQSMDVPETIRPERLAIQKFVDLADALED